MKGMVWMKQLEKNRVDLVLQKTFFDPDQNLREQINDQSSVLDIIFDLEDQLDEAGDGDNDDELYILMKLGHLYKVINKPDESIHYYSEYLKNVPDFPKKQISAFINLGTSYQYAGDYKMALLCFEKAEIIINDEECFEFLDFKEQHIGKYYLELYKYELAMDAFERALELRKEKNDPELIDSTEKSIEFCQTKINSRT